MLHLRTLDRKIKKSPSQWAEKRYATAELLTYKRRSKKVFNKLKNEVQKRQRKGNLMCYQLYLITCKTFLHQLFLLKIHFTYDRFLYIYFVYIILRRTIYLYHEGTARKSPEEVCSFVFSSSKMYKGTYLFR